MKKINLKVRQKDLIENKEETIFKGKANLLVNTSHNFLYHEDKNTKVFLKINEKVGQLNRDGEASTSIKFSKNKMQQAKVSTDVGDILMECFTKEIKFENNKIFLYYELSNDKAIVGRFQLRLEWENE